MIMRDNQVTVRESATPSAVPPLWTSSSVLALFALVALAAAVRVYRIGWEPLWLDEGWSEWASRQSLRYLWRVWPAYDPHPPLYYTLLKGWHALAGNSEAALRMLSMLFGVAAVPLVYGMGRMLNPGRAGIVGGLIAAAMFALSPIHVQYAQEARPYSMLTFAVALALASAMWLMVNPGRACAARQELTAMARGSWLPWVLVSLAVGLAGITWSHFTGGAAVLVIVFALAYWWSAETARCRHAARRLLMTGGLALLLFLPNLWILFDNLHTTVGGVAWLTAPNFATVRGVTTRLLGTTGREGFFALLAFWTLAVLGMASLWRDGRRATAGLLVAVGLFPPIAEVLLSALARPVFLERTLIYVNLPLFVAAGYAVSRIRLVPVRSIVAMSVLALMALGTASYFREFRKEPWHEVARDLAGFLTSEGVAFLLPAHNAVSLNYYAAKQLAAFRTLGVPADWPEPALNHLAENSLPVRRRLDTGDMVRVREYASRSDHVAIVLRNPSHTDPESLLVHEIEKTHDLLSSWHARGVTVMKFSARKGE